MPIKSITDRVRPDLIFAHKLAKIDFLLKVLPEVPVVRMIHDHDLCCPRRHKYYFWNGRICDHKVDWRCFFDLAFLEKRSTGRFKLGYFDVLEHFQQLKKNRLLPCLAVGSRWMQKELLQNGFSDRQVKIHPPVVRLPEPEYKAPGNARSFLYVGQLIRGKGVDLLLQALKKVPGDWQLNIIGEGNARQQQEELAAAPELAGRVHFVGWVPRDRLAQYYEDCSFTLVPSRWPEPFGMVGLEAMTYGRAVIGFAVGGIPDWLEHEVTGLTVPAQNIDAMAAAITRLADNAALAQKMGIAGRARVKELFSMSANLARLEESFSEVIVSRRNNERG